MAGRRKRPRRTAATAPGSIASRAPVEDRASASRTGEKRPARGPRRSVGDWIGYGIKAAFLWAITDIGVMSQAQRLHSLADARRIAYDYFTTLGGFLHTVIEWWRALSTWVYGIMPIHVPPQWHDAVTLSTIAMSWPALEIIRLTSRQRKPLHEALVSSTREAVAGTTSVEGLENFLSFYSALHSPNLTPQRNFLLTSGAMTEVTRLQSLISTNLALARAESAGGTDEDVARSVAAAGQRLLSWSEFQTCRLEVLEELEDPTNSGDAPGMRRQRSRALVAVGMLVLVMFDTWRFGDTWAIFGIAWRALVVMALFATVGFAISLIGLVLLILGISRLVPFVLSGFWRLTPGPVKRLFLDWWIRRQRAPELPE